MGLFETSYVHRHWTVLIAGGGSANGFAGRISRWGWGSAWWCLGPGRAGGPAFSKRYVPKRRRSQNFYRSVRLPCGRLQVTETFEQAASREAIMDRLLDLLIKTFPTKEFRSGRFVKRMPVLPDPFDDN